jgi:hypothetical protein
VGEYERADAAYTVGEHQRSDAADALEIIQGSRASGR